MTIEAFVTPTCPDVKRAWPVLRQLAQQYNPTDVTIILHMFVLPYHRAGFYATQVIKSLLIHDIECVIKSIAIINLVLLVMCKEDNRKQILVTIFSSSH